MGNGIAHVAALAGLEVALLRHRPGRARRGSSEHLRQHGPPGAVGPSWRGRKERGARPHPRYQAISPRLSSGPGWPSRRAPEEASLKYRLFAELDRLAPAGAILASNTSSISITAIAAHHGPSRSRHRHALHEPRAVDGAGGSRARATDQRCDRPRGARPGESAGQDAGWRSTTFRVSSRTASSCR